MLTNREVAERLIAAMDWREPRIPSALVARRCGVTPQAVNKWRNYGQIDFKEHLHTLASVTQVAPMFYLEEKRGQSVETKAIWRRLNEWTSATVGAAVLAVALLTGAPQPAEAGFDILRNVRLVAELYTQCATSLRRAILTIFQRYIMGLQ